MHNRSKDGHILHTVREEALKRPEMGSAAPARREALVFAHIMDAMPIFHRIGDRLAGDFGWRSEDDEAQATRFPPAPPACDTPEARLGRDFHCFGGHSRPTPASITPNC